MKVRYSYLQQQFENCDDLWEQLKQFVLSGDFTLGKPLNEFEENFSKLINDSQSYQQVVQNANNELRENFDNIGQSAKKILDSLKNLKDKNS